MSDHDPFAVLGVGPEAGEVELAAARRRKAWEAHPDRGGTVAAMQAVNAAYDNAVRALAAARSQAAAAAAAAPVADAAAASSASSPSPPSRSEAVRHRQDRRRMQPTTRAVRDDASFTIDALPAEAFEALVVVTSWIGEVLVDDPPYVLEVFLEEPEPCWCRLDLVPDAGGSTVSLTVAGVEGPTPDLDDVRDVWVANLNRLGG